MRKLVLLSCAGVAAVAALAGFQFRQEIGAWAAKAHLGTLAEAATPAPSRAAACPTDPLAPAVTPSVEFDSRPDASGMPARYGALQYPRGPIAPMQVALTIDDGPDAANHARVLDILDRHCLKAAFFFVGWYASARPDLVRYTAARGHTIGTHSFTHPNNLRRLSRDGQIHQISQGFYAAQSALASAPPAQRARLAPFFRFPGLNDSPGMLAWLGQRRIAVFSSDFGADDWKGISTAEIERRALKEAAQSRGGVLILHETRIHTVQGLDQLITDFEKRGYRFVQIAPKPGAREAAASAPGALISR